MPSPRNLKNTLENIVRMEPGKIVTRYTDEIHEILVKRVAQQKQAVGIAVGVIEPNGRRVVAYGNLANGDPRTLDGDTIFEIGSISKVFTSLVLADMANLWCRTLFRGLA
jgi:CubicO group peptidase (beta-lactamase class C family)